MKKLMVLLLLVLAIGFSGWWYLKRPVGVTSAATEGGPGSGTGRGGGGGGGGGRHRSSGPVAVMTTKVVRQDVAVHVDGIGTVQPFNTVTVRTRVEGPLDKVFFKEGQDVKAGDILAQVDPRQFQAALNKALGTKAKDEAQLANVKLDLERFVKLGQFATQQNVDTQRALVRQLESTLQTDDANIAAAGLELEWATIKAPISGRVGIRLIDEGNLVRVSENSGIVVIVQLQPISIIFSLAQQNLAAVNLAVSKGKVKVAALEEDGKTLLEEGELAVVDNRIDTQTGTVKLKATFANPLRQLWPGQFVNVRVELDTRKDGTVIPTAAVQRNASGPFAYVVGPDDKLELRPIRISQIEGRVAVVDAGLEVGQRVVVTSQEQLRPGATVIATEQTAEGNAPAKEYTREIKLPETKVEGGPKGASKNRQ